MKTLAWTGSRGNAIELRASYTERVVERELTSDGFVYCTETKPVIEAALELWVDGVRVDVCRDVNFWQVIDVPSHPGIKSIWGLKVGFSAEQAAKVEEFLAEVIRSGKAADVQQYETEQAEERRAAERDRAQEIVKAAENEGRRNKDGSLMSNAQASEWQRNYNNINNEGEEGYVPSIITQEQLDRALEVLKEQ